jgi:hypothetical protein
MIKFNDIQDAAFAFIKQLRQDDQVMVVSFDSKVRFHGDAGKKRRGRTRSS